MIPQQDYFCHVQGDAQFATAAPSACSAYSDEAKARFSGLKQRVVLAARAFGIVAPINTNDPTLDQATFDVIVNVARAAYMRAADAGQEVAPILAQVAQSADFHLLADRFDDLENAFQQLGQTRAFPPTPPSSSNTTARLGWVALGVGGILFAGALAAIALPGKRG